MGSGIVSKAQTVRAAEQAALCFLAPGQPDDGGGPLFFDLFGFCNKITNRAIAGCARLILCHFLAVSFPKVR